MELDLVTNKQSIKVKGPVSWSEVTTGKYEDLMIKPEHDLIDIISTFYDIDYDLLSACTDQKIIGALSSMSAFVYEDKLEELRKEEYLLVDGQAYRIDPNVRNMSFGQMVKLRKVIEKDPLNCHVSTAVAVYLQPVIDGKFDLDKAMELRKKIKLMPITKTFATGFFFLSKLSNSGNLFMNGLTLLTKVPTKSMIRLLSLRGFRALHHLQI